MKTVLIVDDNVDLLEALKFSIEQMGYGTIIAESGESAMYNILTAKIDLVLSDIRMPSGSGDELMQAFLSHTIPVPIIFMTGFADDLIIKKLETQGAICVLAKPIDIKQLEDLLRENLNV